jgi:hypothetical protein
MDMHHSQHTASVNQDLTLVLSMKDSHFFDAQTEASIV